MQVAGLKQAKSRPRAKRKPGVRSDVRTPGLFAWWSFITRQDHDSTDEAYNMPGVAVERLPGFVGQAVTMILEI